MNSIKNQEKSRLVEFLDNNWNIESDSVPLRVWCEKRGLPSRLITKKYQTKTTNNKRNKVDIERSVIWGRMEKICDYEKRTKQKSKRWYKGSSRRSFEFIKKEGYIWIKIISKWNFIDLKNRALVFDGKYLRLTLNPDEIGIWYVSNEGQIRATILPKIIYLNDSLFELIGILDGEMCRKRNKTGGSSLKISNAEPTIVKHMIDSFQEHFRIKKKNWRASITLNNKNSQFNTDMDGKLKRFWSKNNGISLKNITKTSINKRYLSKFSPKGVIQIRYSNALFWEVLMVFLKNIKKTILSDKKYADSYIRGLIAAEGGIGKCQNGALRVVHIGSINHSEKKFYCDCLKTIDITSFRIYPLRVEIYRKENFLKLYERNIFKLHPTRKKKFIESLNKLSFNNSQRF